jgi:hypothetical protein
MNAQNSKTSLGPNRVVEIVARIYPVWSIRNEECELFTIDYSNWRITKKAGIAKDFRKTA